MSNPRMLRPNDDPALRPHPAPDCSLVESLAATVDEMRQLQTDFGMRPYRVFSVVVRWTGGERGRGEPCVIREQEILPTPLLRLDTRHEATSGGTTERGNIRLTEISLRYTEDDIRALFHVQQRARDQSSFIEIRMDERDGVTTRRRFVINGTPFRDVDRWEWSVPLTEQTPGRNRAGAFERARP